MFDTLNELIKLDGISGDENVVREYIINKIKGHCEYRVDSLGNIIAFKKGKNTSQKKLMIDAHMDEVGLIITSVTADGFLKFKTVGGIDTSVLMFRQVKIGGKIKGVIGGKPIHLLKSGETKKLPELNDLYIDIGAGSKQEALSYIEIGDRAVISSEITEMGGKIKAKALDDRIGCAVLIELLTKNSDYDFYATFSVQEEIGLRGAKTATFAVNPDSALVLEATTAADIANVPDERRVCILGNGPAVSFMDNSAVYDRAYYKAALNSGITCQTKTAVAGGNNSGAIHLSQCGVRTLAISVPCRYIHSASCIADKNDCENALKLAVCMINGICSGNIE